MEKLIQLIDEIEWDRLAEAVISDRKSTVCEIQKIKLRPVKIKEEIYIQTTEYINKKVIHTNKNISEIKEYVLKHLQENFKQALIKTESYTYSVLISKKGQVTTKKKKETEKKAPILIHNRVKKYLLQEGKPVDFLVYLNVMNKDGFVLKNKYDKFRQINRFLEFVDDIVEKLPKNKTINIIDFGCGKSYLTFAIYYYLRKEKGLRVNITGLDLKEDVIDNCNEIAKNLGYEGITFLKGDIAGYDGLSDVDMVVTLHACDTATDYAIAKAIKWNARVLLSVPCCQHEINGQIKNELLLPVLKYGILKERISALITDGIRAEVLEENGYDTQILEFIDLEHTPKNLMIRAVKRKSNSCKKNENLEKLIEELNIKPMIKELI
ncbi:MAG: SAM-dependent methyltransferase [Lachnospiraceae bacterium]|nr:SAM-dependent methyltransferase [Lachnospiraceae bacterium]